MVLQQECSRSALSERLRLTYCALRSDRGTYCFVALLGQQRRYDSQRLHLSGESCLLWGKEHHVNGVFPSRHSAIVQRVCLSSPPILPPAQHSASTFRQAALS